MNEQTVIDPAVIQTTPTAEQLEQSIALRVAEALHQERQAIALFLKEWSDNEYVQAKLGSEAIRAFRQASLLIRSGMYANDKKESDRNG